MTRRRIVRRTPNGTKVSHGPSAYTNYGCRCRTCTEAWRRYHRDYLHRSGRHVPFEEYQRARREQMQHGGQTLYSEGCRCDECMEGMRNRKRQSRVNGTGVACHCGAVLSNDRGVSVHRALMHR